jgi:hypothetical protein
MVRWKGYGPEHDKWVKHSDVFAKDTINAYYHRYPNAPRRIASAAFDSLSSRLLLRPLLQPPLQLMPPTFCPPVLVGTCYATRPMIIVDTSGHVLLGSY